MKTANCHFKISHFDRKTGCNANIEDFPRPNNTQIARAEQAEEHITPPPACALTVDQIAQYSFFRNTANMIHGADPYHLIVSF